MKFVNDMTSTKFIEVFETIFNSFIIFHCFLVFFLQFKTVFRNNRRTLEHK